MHFSFLHKPHLLIPIAGLAFAGTVTGDPPNRPAWWTNGIPPVIPPGAVENNRGPANIGQAKHMADQALKALALKDPALSSAIRQKLTTPQQNPADPTGPNLPKIVEFELPTPLPQNWSETQRAPLLLGQLKAIAAPFYDALHSAVPTWLDHESANESERGQLQLNGTKDPGDPNNFYPWTTTATDDQNKAIATIGQLKAVFSLRFETIIRSSDSDNDGLLDDWEIVHFGDLIANPIEDADGDGLTNAQEQSLGTSPVDIDSDHDGIPDGEDPNPLTPDATAIPSITTILVLTPLQ